MRTAWISVAALGTFLSVSASAHAGIYCTDKEAPPDLKDYIPTRTLPFGEHGLEPMTYKVFRSLLMELLEIRTSQNKDSIRKKFYERRDALQAIVRHGGTLEDKINLGAYLIWLGEYQEAIDLLRPLAEDERTRSDPRCFMVFANFATASQILGNYQDAGFFLIQLRKTFPKPGVSFPGFTNAQLDWFREVEKYQFELLKLRIADSSKPAAERSQSVERLFDVDFVGEDGKFQAGKIAAAQKEKLPASAVAVVQQLLIWLPEASGNYDLRLFWLLGEVYNAQGNIVDAFSVLDQCVSARSASNIPELFEHRRIVNAALPVPPEPPSWIPDTTKLIIVGSATGLVVLFLAFLQVREFRRRRQSATH